MTNETESNPLPLVRILFAFAALCLVTSCGLSLPGGTQKVLENLPAEGGIIGPLVVEDGGTILDIHVYQPVPVGHWSSVTVALLDANKQYLVGVGEGLWHEEGRDYEGYYWRESETSYQGKLTVAEPGEYFFDVSTENNFDASDRGRASIKVDIDEGGFSPIPHRAIGLVTLILAVIVGLFRYRGTFREMVQEQ